MGFDVFVPSVATVSAAAPVKAALNKIGRAKDAVLSLTLTQDFVSDLGWNDGDRLAVLLGGGDDHGIIRLRPSAHEGVLDLTRRTLKRASAESVYYSVRFGHVARFVNRRERAQGCQFERLDDGWLEIVLPAWADETSPAKQLVSGGASDDVLRAKLGDAPKIKEAWGLDAAGKDLLSYMIWLAEPVSVTALLGVLRLHKPHATQSDLQSALNALRSKLDPVPATITMESGQRVRLVGKAKDLARLIEKGA